MNPATFPTDYAAYLAAAANGSARARQVSAEPPLACYVWADCAG